jgi:hypothetical protein
MDRLPAWIALLASLLCSASAPAPEPQLWLWAWERPEDLSFLERWPEVGVAYLAATIWLHDGKVQTCSRRQPITLPKTTPRAAVIRIEAPSGHPESRHGPRAHGAVSIQDEQRRLSGGRTGAVRAAQLSKRSANSSNAASGGAGDAVCLYGLESHAVVKGSIQGATRALPE